MKKWIVFLCVLVCLTCACGTKAKEENVDKEGNVIIERENQTKEPDSVKEEDNSSETSENTEEKIITYKGKKIKIKTKEEFWYLLNYEAINDNQLAIYLREGKNTKILLVYDLSKEEYIAEKKGNNFIWYGEDITTLVYTNLSDLLEGHYEVCDYNDKVIYSAEAKIKILDLKILKKGKLQVQGWTEQEYENNEKGICKEITY